MTDLSKTYDVEIQGQLAGDFNHRKIWDQFKLQQQRMYDLKVVTELCLVGTAHVFHVYSHISV